MADVKKIPIDIITVSPVRIHLSLKDGVNEKSKGYYELLRKLNDADERLIVPGLNDQDLEYNSIEGDVKDIRLFIWEDRTFSEADVVFHIYPNSVAIAEIRFNNFLVDDTNLLSDDIQQKTGNIIRKAYEKLYDIFQYISDTITDNLLLSIPKLNDVTPFKRGASPKIFWTSRAVVLTQNQVADTNYHEMITYWLKDTYRPEDAQDIIAKKLFYSMTWMQYLIVDMEDNSENYRFETLRLAQYLYTAQEICNTNLKKTISTVYLDESISLTFMQDQLAQSRAKARLHRIAYHEHLKYLTRKNRQALELLLEIWEFRTLIENGQRMINVCSEKLEETNNNKQENSTWLTDMLLVSLSFFAVFELSISLTQFSREVMSQPILNYKDDKASFILSFIANIRTDLMILIGIGMTLGLVVLYWYLKRRR